MTSIQQREQLQSQIWKIANEVRGAVMDGTSSNSSWGHCSTVSSVKILQIILKVEMIV